MNVLIYGELEEDSEMYYFLDYSEGHIILKGISKKILCRGSLKLNGWLRHFKIDIFKINFGNRS